MNILFLSAIKGESFAGTTYSIMNLANSQSKIDNVLWYNFGNVERDDWREVRCYNNENDFEFSLNAVEERIGKIDLVVFEGVYGFHPNFNVIKILISNIPYVIVPHGALTKGDQKKKKFKKVLCNWLFYRSFIKKACCIQYLTEREYLDSSGNWNKRHFISPNGTNGPIETHMQKKNSEKIRCIYIGRLEPYQKGLDVLLNAVMLKKEELSNHVFSLEIYGNSVNGSMEWMKRFVSEKMITCVSINNAIYGEEKEEVIKNADIFILPSRYEGMPLGLLEACSYGLPCIVTPGTNMAHLIEKYKAGWVAKLDDMQLAEALICACNDKDKFVEFGENAKKIARQYTSDEIAKEWNKKITEIINSK